ncbi:MAG: GNAT family N-acetyltransferase [bacterium]|nr:GNAT family N-acetyltransferase [bacterium]
MTEQFEKFKPEDIFMMPKHVTDVLVNGITLPDAEVVYQDDDIVVQRLARLSDYIRGVGNVNLNIDFRCSTQEYPTELETLEFRYDLPSEDGEPIADLGFYMMNEGEYDLGHRYVSPEYRYSGGKASGIGSQLFARAELAFQELANRTQESVVIYIDLAQLSVLNWALKNGFEPEEESTELMKQILEHPEDFDLEDIVDKVDGVTKEQFIFRKDTRKRDRHTAERVLLSKTIQPEENSQALLE